MAIYNNQRGKYQFAIWVIPDFHDIWLVVSTHYVHLLPVRTAQPVKHLLIYGWLVVPLVQLIHWIRPLDWHDFTGSWWENYISYQQLPNCGYHHSCNITTNPLQSFRTSFLFLQHKQSSNSKKKKTVLAEIFGRPSLPSGSLFLCLCKAT